MNKIKEIFQKKWLKNQYLTIIQFIITIVFLGVLLIEMPILPALFLGGVVVILVLLLLLVYFLQYNKDAFSIRGMISKIISLIVSLALALGCFFIHVGSSFMDSFTGTNRYVNTMSVIVLKDSSYQELNDIKGKTLNYNNTLDQDNINRALKDIQGQIDINTTTCDSWDQLHDSLFNHQVDAILVNESYRVLLENIDETFSDNTRVIYYVETENKDKNMAHNGSVNDGVFNVLISGIDTYGDISTRSRSDVNMLMTVNMNQHKILLTGIPRDSYMPLAMNGQYDKLTHSGIYGINETMQTIGNFLNVNIDYYYRVNFASLVNVVDVLGGIYVNSDQDLTIGEYHYNQGSNYMNGAMALTFARERHSYSDGDQHRIQNQQEVMIGIINALISSDTLMNYQNILDHVEGTFDTNMSKDDLLTAIKKQMASMQGYAIERQYLTGQGKMTYGLYSMPNHNLYTLVVDETSRKTVSDKINEIMNQ